MISKEQIEARLAQLKKERDQLFANLHAYGGAIQDCEHWLKVLSQEEQPESAAPEKDEEIKKT